MLHQHAARFGVMLAYALKDICAASWGADPAKSQLAATLLTSLATHKPEPEILALAAWSAGIAALTLGQMETAIDQLEQSAVHFEELGKAHTAAETQVSKLIALAMLGRYDEASECGLAARDVFLAHGDQLAAGKIEQNLGNMAWRRNQLEHAEQLHRAARERFIAANRLDLLAAAENGLAATLAAQYRFRQAAQHYQQALEAAQASGLEQRQAEIECNLGNLALFQGQYGRALDYLERSRRRYVGLDLAHESAYADQELAEAYLDLNLITEAAAIYTRVTPLFAELGLALEQAWALAHHGLACVRLGQLDQAAALFASARVLFEAEENRANLALLQRYEAQLAYQQGDYTAAAHVANLAAQEFAVAQNYGQQLQAAWLEAEALRMLGRLPEAKELLFATLQLAEVHRLPQIAQRCQSVLGQIYASEGDLVQAERALAQAVLMIEGLRAPLPAEEFRTAFVADKLAPYADLVRICLEASPPRVADALHYVERARSRALVELLGQSSSALQRPRDAFEAALLTQMSALREELNWDYRQHNRELANDEPDETLLETLQGAMLQHEQALLDLQRQLEQRGGAQLRPSQPFNLVNLQAELGTDTIVLEYYSLDDELLVFLISGNRVEVVRNLASMAEIEALVSQLRFQTDALRRGIASRPGHMAQLVRRSQHYLGRLYASLIVPLEEHLQAERLVIVPHRALHYLPFQALYDGAAYLIERYEICQAPSAAVLEHCLGRKPGPRDHALLLGLPDQHAPKVRDEVLALAPLFDQHTLLLDERANAQELRHHAPKANLIHLACHGRFRPDSPLFSSLRLADGWFTTRDAYELELNCELVVLSACETGVNALAPGDELLGLARGFFAAGAPALLVSLWTINDETTASLMEAFYTRLQQGDTPAQALRTAQRELLKIHPHPFFWSPFILMGRWF